MRRRLTVLTGTIAIGVAMVAAPRGADAQTASESSLSAFPSELTLDVRRGELVEQPIGIIQTGAPERDVRFEVTGDAAGFVSVVTQSGDPLTSLTAAEGHPVYAIVRVAPTRGTPDGQHVARIRIVADDEQVTLGSELRVTADVDGDQDLRAALLGATVVGDRIEVGRPFRVRLDVDVAGSTPIEPIVTAQLDSPDGSVADLEARPPAPDSDSPGTIEVAWPTTGWALGHHRGEIVLASGGAEVGRLPIDVEMVPTGTLVSALTLLDATVASKTRPHGLAAIDVTVRNDGQLAGGAVFVGDLLFGTQLMSAVRSDPVEIAPGEIATLTVHAQLEDAGDYRVRGRAVMDGAESGTIAVDLEAQAASGHRRLWVAIAAGGLLVFSVIVLSMRRRRAPRPAAWRQAW